MIFQLMKLGTRVIPYFHKILTEQPISDIILIIRGHLQGQKIDFGVTGSYHFSSSDRRPDELLKIIQKHS